MRNATTWLAIAVTLAVLGGGAGCDRNGGGESAPDPQPAASSATPRTAEPAREACRGETETRGPLAWYHDDYPNALACARARDVPLVIDMWAPWCHTCLSMQETVFIDPALAPLANRFVWLAIDTDKESSAPALDKFPPVAWPTFFVVSPIDESMQARFVGSGSLTQIRGFLTQGENGHLDRKSQAGTLAGSPLAQVRAGDRASAAEDWNAADTAYSAALAATPADWPRRPDVLVSLLDVRGDAQNWDACVALAEAEADNTGRSASVADFTYLANKCADHVEAPRATALRRRLLARLRATADDADAPLAVDDRSEAFRIARELHLALNEPQPARALAERQRTLLDEAARAAPSPWVAMTYNWPRCEVYVFLGQGEALLDDLRASMAALPKEYDPPYRLAWVLAKLNRYDEALPMAAKAVALAYGPRKGRILGLLADIQKTRGDVAGARATREAQIALYTGLPAGQQNPRALAAAREALAALPAANTPTAP